MLIYGIDFNINWSKFVVGASFFIPFLDSDIAIKQVKRATRRLKFRIKTQVVIERGIQGLRVWRIK